jgi:hypothetical protein
MNVPRLGRAEFEENIESCFEGVPASHILAPAFDERINTGIVYGDRGSGKTRLLRQLATEVPIIHYTLDKDKLQEGIVDYVKLTDSENPLTIVIDDEHYLLKAAQLSTLNKGNLTYDTAVSKLEDITNEAKESNIRVIHVMDESPGAISLRISDEKIRKRYLNLMRGCVANEIDNVMFGKYFEEIYKESNTVDLNNRLNTKQYENIQDLPIKLAHAIIKGVSNLEEYVSNEYLAEWNEKAAKLKKDNYNIADIFMSTIIAKNYTRDRINIIDKLIKKYKRIFNAKFNTGIISQIENIEEEIYKTKNGEEKSRSIFKTKDENITDFYKEKREELQASINYALENIESKEENIRDKSIKFISQTAAKLVKLSRRGSLAAELNMTDIPYLIHQKHQYHTELVDPRDYIKTEDEKGEYVKGRHFTYTERKKEHCIEYKEEPIASMRVLKVLSDTYGGINRKALGLEDQIGEEYGSEDGSVNFYRHRNNGISYSAEELANLKEYMQHLYYHAIGYEDRSLERLTQSKDILSEFILLALEQE